MGTSHTGQLDLIDERKVWKHSLLAKVEGLIPYQVFEHLAACGEERLWKTCTGCGAATSLPYQCCLKFCPLCNWRITRQRARLLKLWSQTIKQPKHLVLTRPNLAILTRSEIRHIQRAFAKIRRTKLFAGTTGGCVSTEVTNESRGWHLHLHILLDNRWLDAPAIARAWGKHFRRDFCIVKVKDCRNSDYLHEVSKYVVKPAQLTTWTPDEINEFIRAVTGVRMHATFGTLFKLARQFRAQIHAERPQATPCACGCDRFVIETERDALLHEIAREQRRKRR